MEFSEIEELAHFVGMTRYPTKRIAVQSSRQYLESVQDRPVENLVAPSPYCLNKTLGRPKAVPDDVGTSSKDYTYSSGDPSSSQDMDGCLI